MNPDRQRLEEDLRGTLAGDVLCDAVSRQLYACDASIYEVPPLAVIRPRHEADLVATVQYAQQEGLSIHARGAGSGLAGESLGRGLVLDFSRYMKRILDGDDHTVRVEAGVVLGALNRHLARSGQMFGPDPAMSQVTTMGSVIAIDAAGSHWLRYGSARGKVRSLRGVLASGEVVDLNQHPVHADQEACSWKPEARLAHEVESLCQRHAGTIAGYRCQSLVNRSGYRLDDVVSEGVVDLARLMAGTEGTLVLITEATLTVDLLPAFRGSVLLYFDSLDKAARGALEVTALEPSACDLMDRRHLNLARESDARYEQWIPGEAEAVLLVEQQADSQAELQEKLAAVVDLLHVQSQLAGGASVAVDDRDNDLFWEVARRYAPTLQQLTGMKRPVPCVEDIAVPPAAIPVFLKHLQDTLKQQHVTASVFAHAGHGQFHIRPFLDLGSPDDVRKMETLAGLLYEKVWLLGGTISGEHGDGLSRTPFLSRQFGPLANVFRELKQVFDARGLLNPGKIVPLPSGRMTHDLRHVGCARGPAGNLHDELTGGNRPLSRGDDPQRAFLADGSGATADPAGTANGYFPLPLLLDWDPAGIALAARACNGCGSCRTLAPEVRMCPIFRHAPREEASPRAKANVVRAVLTGQLPPEKLQQAELKEVADLCVHCHMCRLECPAGVDIPKLMLEAKGQYVEANGQPFQDWALSHIDSLSAIASKFPGIANRALGNPQARWVLEKVLGIAQHRKLPRLARRQFLRWARLRGLHRLPQQGPKVVYFVDTYANYFDTQLGEALVAILRHNRVNVYVPVEQWQSGMPLIARGVLESSRAIAEHNVTLLADAVRQGFEIVATEPAAVLALTHEYPLLLSDDEDARLVAQHTSEAGDYLWQLHQAGKLQLDFRPLPLSTGYHAPCHLLALGIGLPTEKLLPLIPQLRLERLEHGCSGMAGLFGVRRNSYRESLRAGLDLISAMRHGSFQLGLTECSTCKIQMEQSTTKPTIHPLKLLALAYGLMPEIERKVRGRSSNLLVS